LGTVNSSDRKRPPHGGQQPAAPGGLAAGAGGGLRGYGECWWQLRE